jgi:flagellar hook-length control protein FliK
MNTSPTQSSPAIAVDAPASAAASGEVASDLFALLLGSLGGSLGAALGGQNTTPGDATATAADDDTPANDEDFSSLLCQLPGMDGLGLQPLPPVGAELHLSSEPTASPLPHLGALPPRTGSGANALPTLAPALAVADDSGTTPYLASTTLDGEALPVAAAPNTLGGAIAAALGERTQVFDTPDTLPVAQAPASSATPELELVLPPGAAPKVAQAFADGMAVRLGWMADQQIGRAEIELHPAELGSIDVALEFDGKSVRAEFNSSNADVRQLIESTLPRLRDLLEAQGMSLRDANVGSQPGHQGGHGGASRELASPVSPPRSEATTSSSGEPRRAAPQREGGLSEYA